MQKNGLFILVTIMVTPQTNMMKITCKIHELKKALTDHYGWPIKSWRNHGPNLNMIGSALAHSTKV